jgi:hypothetical protein
MAEEKVKGTWWTADDPARLVQGEITYSSTAGATVDLFGALFDDSDLSRLRRRFTLQGLTIREQQVSLFEAAVKGSHMHVPGGRSSVISSVFGVVGGHYLQPSDLTLSEIRVSLTGLRDWTWISGIETKYEEESRGVIYTQRIPDDVFVGNYDGLTAKLQFSATTSPEAGSLTIREKCDLIIEAPSLTPYSAFEDLLYTFQKFVSFALQRPVYATQITGHIDRPRQIIQGHKIFQDYTIIRKLSLKKWDREDLIPQDMLFTLGELDQSLEVVFGRFFSKRQLLKPSMDLYLSTVYNPTQLTRAEFLTLAQSVEGYHRVSMPGKYISDDGYMLVQEALWNAIPSQVSGDFRQSLKNRFKYLHEFSLRKRIEALAEKYESILGNLLGPAKIFASSISDVRNKLTHPTPADIAETTDPVNLWHLSEKIALLLEVCFLAELGFGDARIKEIVRSRSERARHVHFGAF